MFKFHTFTPKRYREQAAKDAESVHRHAQLILKERGWSDDLINENDVKLFCKHAAELRLIRGSCLAAELDSKQLPGEIDISTSFNISFDLHAVRNLSLRHADSSTVGRARQPVATLSTLESRQQVSVGEWILSRFLWRKRRDWYS